MLRAIMKTSLQIRLPPTPESIKIVAPLRPDSVVLVPEAPDALSVDSGFDLTLGAVSLGEAATALKEAGLAVHALVDPEREQVKAAHRMGFRGVSLLGVRLGAARLPETEARELEALEDCIRLANKLGLGAQVSHGLDLRSVRRLTSLAGIDAVEVGHALCGRASLLGMERAVRDFKDALAS